jgi:hypothetical protein
MFSMEREQARTRGRHSGWATPQACVDAAITMSIEIGFPACTLAEIKEMTDTCVALDLVDVKHCDTEAGLQQYYKTSSTFEDYKAYAQSVRIEERPDGTAERWWTKDSQGKYHPDGPTLESRQRFKPIIERFLEGLKVDRCFFMPGCHGKESWQVGYRVRLRKTADLTALQASALCRLGAGAGSGMGTAGLRTRRSTHRRSLSTTR